MEISCPSCGVRHRTEDFPGAFEIQCSCGYSILVPDEKALEPAPSFEGGGNSLPTAMEEEDVQMAIPGHELTGEGSHEFKPSELIENLPGSNEMTAPDDLPEGMVYDPFELPEIPENLENLVTTDSESRGEDPFAAETLKESIEAQGSIADPATVIERSQVASLGQLLGPDYELVAQGLDAAQITSIVDRCRKFLTKRPWLEEELHSRQVDFEDFEKSSRLRKVPEILAVEIYLMCFEAGGRCAFRKMN